MKILIVDDNTDLANGLQEILSIDHHDVSVYYNAEDALKACEINTFDAAFVDVKLPKMNGVELFREIIKASPETHVFIISGYRITQIIEESTGINNTFILSQDTNETEIIQYLNNLSDIPLSLAIADSDTYISRLAKSFLDKGKKPLITSSPQLINHDIKDYDIIILNISEPLIYGLINFIEIKQMGIDIPVILASDRSINVTSKNKLQSFQMTGCLFKPFLLDDILDIVDNIDNDQSASTRLNSIHQDVHSN